MIIYTNELYHSDHKYTKREWKNGRWNYTYDDGGGGGSAHIVDTKTRQYYSRKFATKKPNNAQYVSQKKKAELGKKYGKDYIPEPSKKLQLAKQETAKAKIGLKTTVEQLKESKRVRDEQAILRGEKKRTKDGRVKDTNVFERAANKHNAKKALKNRVKSAEKEHKQNVKANNRSAAKYHVKKYMNAKVSNIHAHINKGKNWLKMGGI